MNATPPKKGFHLEPFKWKSIVKYLLQGLLVIAPIAVTIYAIYWVVSTVDNWLPIFRQPVKDFEGHTIGYEVKNYGLGFVIVIVSVILIGYLSSFFIQSRIFSLFDKWLEKTPGVKYIYSSVRDFFEAFAGNKKKFTHNVLACVDDTDVWRVGFITQEDMRIFGMENYVAVYLPMAYSVAGNVYIVPKERIRPITSISAAQSMKFAVSGGVTQTVSETLGTDPLDNSMFS